MLFESTTFPTSSDPKAPGENPPSKTPMNLSICGNNPPPKTPMMLSLCANNPCASIFTSPILVRDPPLDDKRKLFESQFPILPFEEDDLPRPMPKPENGTGTNPPTTTQVRAPDTPSFVGECTPCSTAPDGSKKCKCKRSQCVRLHCVCFSDGGYCGPYCSCVDCLNSTQFENARQFVIQKTKEINPLAFTPKVKKIDSSNKVLNPQGCKCTRNNCNKNYCDCYKNGIGCSSVCRCSNCLNNKVELKKEEAEEVGGRVFRKKDKIVISLKDGEEAEPGFCTRAITYVPHRKKIRKDDDVKE